MSRGTHPTTPWMPWFAWRPVSTLTHGWLWLCWIERQRIMCNSNGPVQTIGYSFWMYRKPVR
jgi:hypothetical protein